jgi:Ca2+-transporting ATPase
MANWHQLDALSVAKTLGSDVTTGLKEGEAERRLDQFGPNELTKSRARSAWQILCEQLAALMMIILICAAIISTLLADYKDAIAIGAIVFLNAILGFSQDYRAEQAITALKRLTSPSARVRRDGQEREISSTKLVPGDVLLLEAGNVVPADCRILESKSLETLEATLTGESEPVRKISDVVEQPALVLADRRNMAYQGTFVTSGNCAAIVTETGMRTELGRIANLVQNIPQETTPLQRRLDQLGKRLVFIALCVVSVIFVVGLLRGEDLKLMFLTAVSISVAAVPEGLPAVVTIALTLGAQRMLKRRALIRKLPAVETLGSVTVICTDKTGTLTENRMTATVLQLANERLDLQSTDTTDGDLARTRLLIAGGALCNNARLPSDPGSQTEAAFLGDPTEIALLQMASRFGLRKEDLERALPRVDEVPFSAERKRMTTVHGVTSDSGFYSLALPPNIRSGMYLAFTKGASDSLLRLATSVWIDGNIEPMNRFWLEALSAADDDLAQNGLRVLGVAFRYLDALPAEINSAIEHDLVFLGMTGIVDPPRVEAANAVAKCKAAGIRSVMITGDHPLTAKHIASMVGIDDAPAPVIGSDLDRLSADALREVATKTAVYARVSPEHKLKIVESLQQQGEVVAMTGDGVNDAPALRRADIGVAMGMTGTDVAKDAADMILMDDNFATIVGAVEEGRIIYGNIRKFIRYILTTNSGELLVMLVAPVLGMPLPLTPLQILWMNLATDGLPALALSIEPAESTTMRHPPIHPGETIFSRGLGRHVIWVGLSIGFISLTSTFWYWRAHDPNWQTFLFTVLTLSQMAHVMAIRSEHESLFRIGILSNKPLLGAVLLSAIFQLGLVYVPFLQAIFKTKAMPVPTLAVAVGLSSIIFMLVELEKYILRHKGPGIALRATAEKLGPFHSGP